MKSGAMTGKQQRSLLCPGTSGLKLRKGQMGCFKCGVEKEILCNLVNKLYVI